MHPSSCLFGRRRAPACVVYAELVVTTKPYMRCCTAVRSEWLVELLPQFFAFQRPEDVLTAREAGAMAKRERTAAAAPKKPARRNLMVDS